MRESLRGVTGPCCRDKWMSLPEMGYVIATKYRLVLVSLTLSPYTCFTFFPLKGTCPPTQSAVTLIAIGFVNSKHWVYVLAFNSIFFNEYMLITCINLCI